MAHGGYNPGGIQYPYCNCLSLSAAISGPLDLRDPLRILCRTLRNCPACLEGVLNVDLLGHLGRLGVIDGFAMPE